MPSAWIRRGDMLAISLGIGDIETVCYWGPPDMGVSIAMGVPQNGWFIRGNPIEMDYLGVSLFMETSILVGL